MNSDPDLRRAEHLIETGRRVRLKRDIPLLMDFVHRGIPGHKFSFVVISAAPTEVVQSALDGVVPSDHIFGTELDYDSSTGEIRSIARVPAGYGKVAVLDEIVDRMNIAADRTVYVGDGSSDIHATLHVNHRDGFTISVSKNGHLAHIAKRTILSDSAFGMVLPVLEHVFGWPSGRIRTLFQSYGLPVQEWERIRTDVVTLG